MENEPPRRRVRRAKQSRPVAPGVAVSSSAAERRSAPPPEEVGDAASLDAGAMEPAVGAESHVPSEATASVAEPDVPPERSVDDEVWDAVALPDSSRDGAWLPAGITVLVMVSLLICAGLVLIASRQ
jgi:hypothetical protein